MSYRGLGFDPTPGSVDAVAQTVERLRAAADALSSVEPAVRAAAGQLGGWQGAAADAFRGRLTAPSVAPGPLLAAIPVLEQWAATLAANLRRTEELDATALRLRRALDDARDALQDKQNALDLASTPAAAASATIEVSAAAGRIETEEAALEAVLSEARELERAHRRAADEAADALDTDAAPRQDQPAVRALAGLLDRSSRTSATLAGLLAPGPFRPAPPAAGVLAAALAGSLTGTGEPIVLGETPLRERES